MSDETYTSIKTKLATILGSYLGEYELSNGDTVPSIWIGDPEAKVVTPGIEVVIDVPTRSKPQFLLGYETNKTEKFRVQISLWTPKLLSTNGTLGINSVSEVVDLLYKSETFQKVQQVGIVPATRTTPQRVVVDIISFSSL